MLHTRPPKYTLKYKFHYYQEGHWGYCDKSCLPGYITWYIIILIIVGTLTLFGIVTLLVLYSLGKLRCRCYGNNTTDHFIFTFRNCCLKKCFNNDQANPDETTMEMGKFS